MRRPLRALPSALHHAVRTFRRAPVASAIAIVTLSLGIGAATAMFSVLRGIALRDLPVNDAHGIGVFWLTPPGAAPEHLPFTYRELQTISRSARTLDGVAGIAFQGAVDAVVRDRDHALPVAMTWVTGNFFSVLGAAPARGRLLEPGDDAPGAAPVAVISHAMWRSAFGEAPNIVGRSLTWNGTPYTIVGVAPRGLTYPAHVQLWMPVLKAFPGTLDPSSPSPAQMVFDVVGRVRSTANVGAAQSELQRILREDAARSAAQRSLQVDGASLHTRVVGDVTPALRAASLAAALLLLVACINVANLQLLRAGTRAPELAIRVALGAGRSHIVWQLFTETAVLAAIGGVVGVSMAYAAVQLLVRLAPDTIPQLDMIAIDARVLLAAATFTAVAAVLAGMLPALFSMRGDPAYWLRGGHGSGDAHRDGKRGRLVRSSLLIGQVGMAVLVVACAGLVARSLFALASVEVGFRTDNLLIAETSIPAAAFTDHAQQVAFQERVITSVRALPGVVAATAMPKPPYSAQGGWLATFSGEEQTDDARAGNPTVNFEVVGPDYFGTLDLPLVRGRAFGPEDRDDRLRVAIVSASLAARTWPGRDAIGQRLKLGPIDGRGEWLTVIGVAGETRYRDLTDTLPTLYLPTRQFAGPVPMTLALRTSIDANVVLPMLRAHLRELHPDLLLSSGASIHERQRVPLAQPRFSAALLSASAVVTLALALVGVFGTIATMVRERTREIGIRMALGESPQRVQARFLGQAMTLLVVGCVVGLVATWYVTPLLRAQLFGVGVTDPITYVGVVVLLGITGGLACWIPARRASRVDPVTALRGET